MALWIDAYDAIESEMDTGGDYEQVRAAASKAGENIARMAGVMAAFSGQTEIDKVTMAQSIKLGGYYLEQFLRHTRSQQQYAIQNKAHRLLNWLKSQPRDGNGGISATHISRNAPGETGVRGSVDKVRAMMQRLIETGAAHVAGFNRRDLPATWRLL